MTFALFMIIVVLLIISILGAPESNGGSLLLLPIVAGLITWFAISANEEWRDEKIVVETAQVQTLDGGEQVAVFEKTTDKKDQILNVNTRFGKRFDGKVEIELVEQPGGWYKGIYWESERYYRIQEVGENRNDI
jgi:hypothetical protein